MDPIEIRDKEHVITLLPGNYSVRVRWGGGEEDTGVWRGEILRFWKELEELKRLSVPVSIPL
ncbi:MAG: hypothetical protein DRO89_05535 [Candidatus Altiarchaeales archaeon]|nr:MAG: hypothetical protein DRO89_05535 [Candidatus Altiarchaeales archaeon]